MYNNIEVTNYNDNPTYNRNPQLGQPLQPW